MMNFNSLKVDMTVDLSVPFPTIILRWIKKCIIFVQDLSRNKKKIKNKTPHSITSPVYMTSSPAHFSIETNLVQLKPIKILRSFPVGCLHLNTNTLLSHGGSFPLLFFFIFHTHVLMNSTPLRSLCFVVQFYVIKFKNNRNVLKLSHWWL